MTSLFNFFLLAIFLFRISNIYIIPGFNHSLITTHVLARLILGFCFLKIIFLHPKTSRQFVLIAVLLLLALVIQSLSIIHVINIRSYLERYEDILVGIAAFYTFYFFKDKYRKIVIVLVCTALINIFFQLLLFISLNYNGNSLILNIFPIYEKQYALLLKNIARGRIYLDTFDEALLPIFLMNIPNQIRMGRVINILTGIMIGVVALVSVVRSRVLMMLIAIYYSWRINRKQNTKKIICLTLITIMGSILLWKISANFAPRSIIDRFMFSNEQEDIVSIKSRTIQALDAWQLGQYSILGVGLGNYYDHLQHQQNQSLSLQKSNTNNGFASGNEFPHNLFALWFSETSYIGLLLLMIMLSIFAKNDLQKLHAGSYQKKAFIGAFWTLFVFSLFNPPTAGTFQILFFGLRGLITS